MATRHALCYAYYKYVFLKERIVSNDDNAPLTPAQYCEKYGHNPGAGGTKENPTKVCTRCHATLS